MGVRVLAVIGARLNSSRLPRKHLLDLAGVPLIGRLFQRLERVPEITDRVLATTADDYNRPLVDWAQHHGKEVFAFKGDVNDLVGRVDAVVRRHEPDMVLYVCGDSPLIEPSTLSRMIQALSRKPDACMALLAARNGPPIHEGFDLYRASFWHTMAQASQEPHEREHVGASMRHQWNQLPMAPVVDEPIFYSIEHRLSVDTPSDYRFMKEVYNRWYSNHPEDSIVSLPLVIQTLLEDQNLRAINASVKQKKVGRQSNNVLIALRQGPKVGLGHLGRMLTLARALQDCQGAGVKLLIEGPALQRPDLALIPHEFCDQLEQLLEPAASECDSVVIDLPQGRMNTDLLQCLERLAESGINPISIDFSAPVPPAVLNWAPSFYVKPELAGDSRHHSGWDTYLIKKPDPGNKRLPGLNLAVLTGGSDAFGLGRIWPVLLDRNMPQEMCIHWIRGPYAPKPDLPEKRRLKWIMHHNPDNLGAVLDRCNMALSVYGVSLFECLSRGMAAVALATENQNPQEIKAFADAGVAKVAFDAYVAVTNIGELAHHPRESATLAKRAAKLLDGQGPERLAALLIAETDQRSL